MKIKNVVRTIIIVTLLTSFSYYLFFSKKGIKHILALKQECAQEQQEVDLLTTQVATLKKSIYEWNNNPFAKELTAREDLHMTYTNETVYITNIPADKKV